MLGFSRPWTPNPIEPLKPKPWVNLPLAPPPPPPPLPLLLLAGRACLQLYEAFRDTTMWWPQAAAPSSPRMWPWKASRLPCALRLHAPAATTLHRHHVARFTYSYCCSHYLLGRVHFSAAKASCFEYVVARYCPRPDPCRRTSTRVWETVALFLLLYASEFLRVCCRLEACSSEWVALYYLFILPSALHYDFWSIVIPIKWITNAVY